MRKVNRYFQQFQILTALRLILFGFFKKMLNPKAIITYSQFGEDQYIQTLLNSIQKGFYLDIGCNHPIRFSNTFGLYCTGWRGICVDANQNLIREFSKVRKRDKTIYAAVSDEEIEMDFYESTLDLASTLNSSFVEGEWMERNYELKEKRRMKTVTLNTILTDFFKANQNQAPQRIDLLCIDVEGHDFNVLKSIDIEKYRPSLIVIEMHGFNKIKPNENEIYQYMNKHNYELAGYHIINGFFIARGFSGPV
ncbi:MAG TPA: FkbM family methyltransferase [Chitinophagaceae bacterium]|nr:FkbM family methyltransferase [Chitinophagaceae bacterium]